MSSTIIGCAIVVPLLCLTTILIFSILTFATLTSKLRPEPPASVRDVSPRDGSLERLSAKLASLPYIDEIDALEKFSIYATDVSGADHTPLARGEIDRGYGAHLGPLRSARAMAIVHIAMCDSILMALGGATTYTRMQPKQEYGDVSISVAIAVAAGETLNSLFPLYKKRTNVFVANFILSIVDSDTHINNGILLGQAAAEAILRMRANDGSAHAEVNASKLALPLASGIWRPDPSTSNSLALGASWASLVTPFAIRNAMDFLVPPPAKITGYEFAMNYAETLSLGGDGTSTVTARDAWRTFVGNFWAYDGTPSLCAPPRLYIQIAHAVMKYAALELKVRARLLGTYTIAMADATTAAWASKYHYLRERPVTYIRESADYDDNYRTVVDPNWQPLGAPSSNLDKPNFTPPFPSYPSAHATTGSAAFSVLRAFLGTDQFTFTFVSDEYNGTTRDKYGVVRSRIERSFASFSEMEEENGQSRIYLGIHWADDKKAGIAQGRKLAKSVMERVYQLTQASLSSPVYGAAARELTAKRE